MYIGHAVRIVFVWKRIHGWRCKSSRIDRSVVDARDDDGRERTTGETTGETNGETRARIVERARIG